MSYCVNCGVELEKSQQRCPLCGVAVVNPAEPYDEKSVVRPYPKHIERLNTRVDRRYTAAFVSLLLLIPVFICIFTNVLTSATISWSLYVLGGALLLFTWLLLPLMLERRNVYLCVVMDGLAAALFLLGVEMITERSWFLRLGLPLTALATLYTLGIASLCNPQNGRDLLVKIALMLLSSGVTVVLVECIVDHFQGGWSIPQWSVYAFIPCTVLSILTWMLNKRAKLKSELKRRFYV